jgi:hypothetical protein
VNVERFEQLARPAPDTVTLELLDGALVAEPLRDGNHSEIVAWLCARFARDLPSHWLHDGRRLRVGTALAAECDLTESSPRGSTSQGTASGLRRTVR